MEEKKETTVVDLLIEEGRKIEASNLPEWLKRDIFRASVQNVAIAPLNWGAEVVRYEPRERSG